MLKGTYKNYRICPCCGQELPLTRKFFKRLVLNKKESFHKICRECEEKLYIQHEWKDGKLLCHDCKQYKSIDCFNKNPDARLRNFRATICTQCRVKRNKQFELTREDSSKLRKILNARLLGARDRAKKHNLQFDITLDYLLQLWEQQSGICALSGINMTCSRFNGRTHTNVSIDRINPTDGYIKGNIQLVCMACNQIKSDMTDFQMYNFCKHIVDHYEQFHVLQKCS